MSALITAERQSFWQDRPTLVTGATGLLGAWLTRTLIDLGADVVALIRDNVPHSELVRSGTVHEVKSVTGSVTDLDLMCRVFSDYEIDTCFHLAAQTQVGIANRMPVPTFESNIRGTWNVLEAARLWPETNRVIVASSDKAYGDQAELPYNEHTPLEGRHPYDVSKSCADLIAQSYAHTFDLPVAVTRCGNMFGGGDLNWNRIVPGVMRWAIRGEQPVIRSDGTLRRDYIYVLDVVDAYLTLAEAMVDGAYTGAAYNFGLNRPLSVMEITQHILAISPHPTLEPMVLGEAKNEIKDQYLDSSRAAADLDWAPVYSLEEGLKETLAWYTTYLNT
ncbi:MAG: NAD-dependent epimerase/dehydratase family protein [Chloroflexi bacterium]|nr:NAD-dependent epimerase/dehydratase family protein [Chloroflexota bacterium]